MFIIFIIKLCADVVHTICTMNFKNKDMDVKQQNRDLTSHERTQTAEFPSSTVNALSFQCPQNQAWKKPPHPMFYLCSSEYKKKKKHVYSITLQ